jgi:hypothetical protein
MTTTVLATVGSADDNRHAGLDLGRAGAHAPPAGKTYPTVLTSGHQAEAGAICIAEFEATQGRAMQQDRREKQIALARLDRLAVDREWDRRARARNEAPEQAGFGNIDHDGLFIYSMCS